MLNVWYVSYLFRIIESDWHEWGFFMELILLLSGLQKRTRKVWPWHGIFWQHLSTDIPFASNIVQGFVTDLLRSVYDNSCHKLIILSSVRLCKKSIDRFLVDFNLYLHKRNVSTVNMILIYYAYTNTDTLNRWFMNWKTLYPTKMSALLKT